MNRMRCYWNHVNFHIENEAGRESLESESRKFYGKTYFAWGEVKREFKSKLYVKITLKTTRKKNNILNPSTLHTPKR